MTSPAAARTAVASSRPHSWIVEGALRLAGGAFQVLATWEITRVMTPADAGVYFRGFVIALGLSTLLRGKYEISLAEHIIGHRELDTGIGDRVLLMQLARRLAVRASLTCGALLVVIADLDIQAPQLQDLLQTYLPFVLALPCVSLAALFGEALRAANHTLGIVVNALAVNICIVLATVLLPPGTPLWEYSWAFLSGSIIAAALAYLLARREFALRRGTQDPMPLEMERALDARELPGLARAVLLWGPLCVLCMLALPVHIAEYAVAVRTALIADFILPALNLTGCRETLGAREFKARSQRRLARALGAALVVSSAVVGPLALLAGPTLRMYGQPYAAQVLVYMCLLGVQWLNGLGRPALRFAVAQSNPRQIGTVVGWGALVAMLIAISGVPTYGALAAATASLAGALVVTGRAVVVALRESSRTAES